ncbi:glycosyl transferase family protein [Dinoroseobacter sp. S375]|uniref:glycosyl transferase family protein n=1 Tax=Dinoroseobacter sp. S375 TaxID=3415136 RepID=UPI003C7E5542
MSLAPYIATVARGPGRARPLTQTEAQEAMTHALDGTGAPEAVGALLMTLRLRGETADEITGFSAAFRAHLRRWSKLEADLDWPSYSAGRTRGLPWFLLSARLVAAAGYRIMIHGRNGSDAALRAHLGPLGLSMSLTPTEAATALEDVGIAYVPLEALSARATDLLALRDHLGLRSCVNTCLRVANPAAAPVTVQGVFHPPYRELQEAACERLGDNSAMIIKGGGGEFERYPGKPVVCHGFGPAGAWPDAPAILDDTRRLTEVTDDPAHLTGLWEGSWHHPFATATVLGTAALALWSLGATQTLPEAEARAATLWSARQTRHAA